MYYSVTSQFTTSQFTDHPIHGFILFVEKLPNSRFYLILPIHGFPIHEKFLPIHGFDLILPIHGKFLIPKNVNLEVTLYMKSSH